MHGDPEAVRDALARLQTAYRLRDPDALDEYLELYAGGDEAEMLGTEAARRGDFDWGRGRAGVRAITEWDWRYWYEVELDVAGARVTVRGDVAWLTAAGALVQSERSRAGLRRWIEEAAGPDVRAAMDDESRPPEQGPAVVVEDDVARLRELQAPVGRRRPFTFSAVLVRDADRWLFHTTHWAIAAQ
jgi:hypothetical protein